VPRRLYNRYARFLCQNGFLVITFDYRGMGESQVERSSTSTLRDWGEKDLAGIINYAGGKGAVSVVGHSLGGQLVGIAPNNEQVRALLLIAAGSGYWGWWPFPQKLVMASLWYIVMPALTSMLGYFPGKKLRLSEDLPAGPAKQWASWCRNRAYLLDESGKPDRQFFCRFDGPVLSYSFAGDPYAPEAAVDELLSWFSSARRDSRHIDAPLGHFGFFRNKNLQPLWRETVDWLKTVTV